MEQQNSQIQEQYNISKAEAEQIYKTLLEDNNKSDQRSLLERAFGCILGAFIGDALGSHVEFSKPVLDEKMDHVMQMPGKGHFSGILPGQLTDDSEMALSLADGLLKQKEIGKIDNPGQITLQYGLWLQSDPFDLGMTVSQGIKHMIGIRNLDSLKESSIQELYQNSLKDSQKYNKNSQSNGCLMRISPMALFNLSAENLDQEAENIKKDVNNTHSNIQAQIASITYTVALTELIKTGDPEKAYSRMEEYLNNSQEDQKEIQLFKDTYLQLDQNLSAQDSIGWAKIAWNYSFLYLKQCNSFIQTREIQNVYQEYLRQIIQKGGDTDTNAAIVGAMIGAHIGIKNIPQQYIQKNLDCNVLGDFTQNQNLYGYSRPLEYSPFRAFIVAKQLLAKQNLYPQ